MGLLQSGEKTKVGQMSHSLLGSQQVDAYMFGTQKQNKPTGQSKGVLVGLLWSGRHCFVTVKVQLLGRK